MEKKKKKKKSRKCKSEFAVKRRVCSSSFAPLTGAGGGLAHLLRSLDACLGSWVAGAGGVSPPPGGGTPPATTHRSHTHPPTPPCTPRAAWAGLRNAAAGDKQTCQPEQQRQRWFLNWPGSLSVADGTEESHHLLNKAQVFETLPLFTREGNGVLNGFLKTSSISHQWAPSGSSYGNGPKPCGSRWKESWRAKFIFQHPHRRGRGRGRE